ncbi:hypothetical protein SCHPADRAFT_926067 [Schizopora paradoxa]|uniref:MYND-type domain-containing protein n=1 Tax=Schizopora paradoxa TaxID=27342 RepID=A0A0H2S645_9AGAM|nr:hypothetical protein SCHPADRAFT_926067 [Schizopora paradoxa]
MVVGSVPQKKLATRDVIKALKSARTQLDSLNDLSFNLSSLPEKYHTDAFNVFCYHLQKPVELSVLESPKAFRFVLTSLLGIGALGSCKYFPRNVDHLLKCWPETLKWGKAILQTRLFHDLEETFFRCADGVFNMASGVDLDLMRDDSVLDFAVDLWKGHRIKGKGEYFTTGPLLCCMTVKSLNEKQVDYLYKFFACDERYIIRKLLRRFHKAGTSTPKDTTATTDLSDLLRRLESFSKSPLSHEIRCTNAIPIAISVMDALMDDPNQTPEHGFSVRFSLDFLLQIVPTQTNYIGEAISSGVIRTLVRVAANQQYKCLEKPVYLLNEIQLGLVFKDILTDAITSMKHIAEGNLDVSRLLQSATLSFQEEWAKFSSLLLEHAVILELFDNDHGIERGSCACCQQMSERKEFKQCSGCGIILYCSKACQRRDWPRHRKMCERVDDESIGHLIFNSDRWSRRLATLQVNRYWPSIVSLAKEEGIPLDYLGVQVRHDSVPFKIEVHDFRDFYDEINPLEPMMIKEILRRRKTKESHPCTLLTITHMGMAEVSYMIYLDNALDYLPEKMSETRGAICLDENDKALFPAKQDNVEDIISRSHMLSDSDWRILWRNLPFQSLASADMQNYNK